MSLTTRLSTFFLLALAVVLAGFSLSLYLLASSYLRRQVDERLLAAMNTLSAAAEVKPDEVEWEPHQRHVQIGDDIANSAVEWTVHGEAGQLIDQSANLPADDPLRRPVDDASIGDRYLPRHAFGKHRRCLRRLLKAASSSESAAAAEHEQRSIVLTVAVSEKPVEELLERLALALILSSSGLLLTAVVAGRWFCRRALRPVARMAEQAKTMKPDERANRLSVPKTHDEVEALGAEFNGLLDRLHEALERQERFTGDASHQLRTPLAALLGQVEVALRHPRSADEYRQTLVQAHVQGQHLRQIVEMLLFLARADAEARLEEFVPLNLTKWLIDYAATWSAHPRIRDLQAVSVDGPCRVRVHPALLGQMLGNLIDNAFKYSEPGTPVILRLRIEADRAILAVEDRGIGVGANDRPHLFDPFFRSDRARSLGQSGVGLGLSVAQRIAHLFGAEIIVAANPNVGSIFTVKLPFDPGVTE